MSLLKQRAILAALVILGATAMPASASWSSDFDGDGDVDLTDFGGFAACFNGPNRAPAASCAVDADLDDDTDVDLTDFGIFAACFNGPNRTPACVGDPTPPGMVLIPAGEFQMGDTFSEGSTYERPVHAVYVDAFYMDRYEVTNQQYADALNWASSQGGLITVTGGVVYQAGTGTSYPYCYTTVSVEPRSRITWNGSVFDVTIGKENHPMVLVSWYGAAAYANWRSSMEGRWPCYNLSTWSCNFGANGYRLPTEAEWERGGRGGVAGRRFPWSDQDTIQHARANYYSSAAYSYDTSPTRGYHPLWGVSPDPYTSPVGFFNGSMRYKVDFNWPGSATSYQTANGANGYGLHDMAGNALEWCNDWFSSTYYSTIPYPYPHVNPHGPTSGLYRVLRGGGWDFVAAIQRVALRGNYGPDGLGLDIGFRCAAGIP